MWIISEIGSFASIISLALMPSLAMWIRILIGFIGAACLGYMVYTRIQSNKENEILCFSPEEIKDNMKKLVKTQGKVCVMSRDLSWVDSEIEACIVEKKTSVLIFAQKSTELTKRLIEKGVDVRYYGKWNFEPRTRFTVVRYNRENPQVAIAFSQDSVRKKERTVHRIYETVGNGCKQDKWINSLALDMITLCGLISEGESDDETHTP